MAERSPIVCISCGLAVGTPPRLNALANGAICPTCKDRVLDWIPPALPKREVGSRQPSAGDESATTGDPSDVSSWPDRPDSA